MRKHRDELEGLVVDYLANGVDAGQIIELIGKENSEDILMILEGAEKELDNMGLLLENGLLIIDTEKMTDWQDEQSGKIINKYVEKLILLVSF